MKKKVSDNCDFYTDGENWQYTELVKEHFLNPRNILIDETNYRADGIGSVNSATCGDLMNFWIKVDKKNQKIKECFWRTFGCASAIASASMLSIMVTENGGMSLKKAQKLKPEEISKRLGGLPNRKFHCSILCHEALKEAILDYLD